MLSESANPDALGLKEPFLSYSWSFGEDAGPGTVRSYKATDRFRYDGARQSVPGTLEKGLFLCGFKGRRIMSFSLVTSQLFSLRLHGGLFPACSGCSEELPWLLWAENSGNHRLSCFSFYNRRELGVLF